MYCQPMFGEQPHAVLLRLLPLALLPAPCAIFPWMSVCPERTANHLRLMLGCRIVWLYLGLIFIIGICGMLRFGRPLILLQEPTSFPSAEVACSSEALATTSRTMSHCRITYCTLCFPNIPAIATDNLYFFILFCLFTTCFGPYGPSSGETQQHYLYVLWKLSYYSISVIFTIFTYMVYFSYYLFIYLQLYNGNSFN
jgi:hypothetical protein